jgi:tRNA(Ile)-lysidine synthase
VLHPGEGAVLMLSGGPDSMALLAIVAAVDRRLGLKLRLAAAHVDYRTRGDASDRDREIVARACEAAGVPLHLLRLERPLDGGSFQAHARELRYRYAREAASREAASVVVTGHNRDDQAETVLYRLAKYASPRGLAGMRPRERDLARPLLCLGAAEVRAYCRAAGVAYGEDASNATAAYARNALRLEVIPRLEALNPRVAETLAASALQAAAEADVLLGVARAARLRAAADPGPRALAAVDVAALAAEPAAVRAIVLHDLAAEALGGGALVERRLVEALLALAARPGGGKTALGRGLEAAREGGLLVVRRAPSPHVCAPVPVDGLRLATTREGVSVSFCGRRVRLTLRPGAVFERVAASGGTGYAGCAAPPARVVLRHPRRGERFAPAGLGGETTLARFLAAAHVSPDERRRAVVLDVDGAAAWVGFAARGGLPAARVAQSFLVDESSGCTLHIELEEA